MSGERYLAIRHPFVYENVVTETRMIEASGVTWICAAVILPIDYIFETNTQFKSAVTTFVTLFVFIPLMVYFNVIVYKEVRRNEKQIAANQISLEANEKLLKNKRAFYTTTIVLVAIFLCYIPGNVWVVILVVL